MSPVPVHHDTAHRCFAIEAGGKRAVAEYELAGDQMIFTHTFVPEELRGQGLAGRLVRAGLDFARHGKKKVVPRCNYVEIFLKRHPEFQDLSP